MNGKLLQFVRDFCIIGFTGLISACSGVASGSLANPAKHAYQAAVKALGQEPATQLQITVQDGGQPANFSDGKSILHAHIVPADVSTLYHEHPRQVKPGEFTLDSPVVQPGDYDVWIEVTSSSSQGHIVDYLQKFPMKLSQSAANSATIVSAVRLEPQEMDIQPAGKPSKLGFLLTYQGAPVKKLGSFVGVEVHQWAISKDRTFLVHNHADLLGNGRIRAEITFPRPGDYVVFVQPAVPTDGGQITPMLSYPVTVH